MPPEIAKATDEEENGYFLNNDNDALPRDTVDEVEIHKKKFEPSKSSVQKPKYIKQSHSATGHSNNFSLQKSIPAEHSHFIVWVYNTRYYVFIWSTNNRNYYIVIIATTILFIAAMLVM